MFRGSWGAQSRLLQSGAAAALGVAEMEPTEQRTFMLVRLEGTDLSLFAACTSISVCNETLASFWNDRWLNGLELS